MAGKLFYFKISKPEMFLQNTLFQNGINAIYVEIVSLLQLLCDILVIRKYIRKEFL